MADKAPPGSVVRRSMSRPDSSGRRKDIPVNNSLESMPQNSAEQCATIGGSRGSSAGATRARTPVGSAAPPRRSTSANRSYLVQVHQLEQQRASLPDDDSLVLYKDPSGLTAQESVGSVVSGRHRDGETFFTALRRNYSFEMDSESELAPEAQATTCSLACMDSQVNPMRSPSSSVDFGADNVSAYFSAAGSLQDEYSKAGSMATCESSATTLYLEDTAASTGHGLVPTASVMDVINSLYCATTAASGPTSSQQQMHAMWLSQDDAPLIAHPAAAAAAPDPACAPHYTEQPAGEQHSKQPQEEQSIISSVGSCDPLAGTQGTLDIKTSYRATAPTALGEQEQQRGEQQQHEELRHSLSSAESAAGCAAIDSAVDAEAREASWASAAAPDIQQQDKQTAEHADATDVEQHCSPIQDDHTQADPGLEITDQQQAHDAAASYLHQVQSLLESRAQLQAELSGYVTGLTSRLGEDGQQLVELPKDYELMVERMLCEHKLSSRALEGWEGLHRYDELSIAQLPATHDDPNIAAGLEVIRQLDAKLKDAWIKAQVAARGVAPEQWAAAERQRLEARAAQLEKGLARERQKRLHAARLLRALKKLDEQQVDELLMPGAMGLSSYSYYKLQPQEEQLLTAVLGRDEAELEQHNPFDASTMCLFDDGPAEEQSSLDASLPTSQQLSKQCSACSNTAAEGATAAIAGAAAEVVLGKPAGAAAASAVAVSQAQQDDSVAASLLPAAAVQPAQRAPRAGSLCSTHCSLYSIHSAASSSKQRRTLAEIDALLEALQDGYGVGHGSLLGSTRPSSEALSSTGSRCISQQSAATAHDSEKAAAGALHSAKACARLCGSGGIYEAREQKRDYVREQREAKELLQRERDIDSKLRAVRTSELPAKLTPDQLQALLQQCAALQQAAACL